MLNVLYTIGYSGYKVEEFLSVIKERAISTVIDVRSVPYSQYHSDYNKEVLKAFLNTNRVHYRNYAKEFGAQQISKIFYSPNGYLDFDIFTKSEEFLSGIGKLKSGMDSGYTFVLMCAEKDPINCHRAIMVAREFQKNDYNIVHLLPDGNEQSQRDIETRLLERYFPNRKQLTIFENSDLTNQDMIDLSYRKRNAEIGYTMGGERNDNIYNRVYSKNSTAVL